MVDAALILLIRVIRRLVNVCFLLIVIISFPFLFPAYALLGWWAGRGVGRDD